MFINYNLKKPLYLYIVMLELLKVHMKIKTYRLHLEKSQKSTLIPLSASYSCMAGAYQACNHFVATLYKIEYANSKGWRSPSCTETVCQWNQSTEKDIEPKRITELFLRRSLRTKQKVTCTTSREKTRTKHLLSLIQELKVIANFVKSILNQFWKSLRKLTKVLLFSNHLKQMLLIGQKSVLKMQTFSRYVK